jgi:hypothetical protein
MRLPHNSGLKQQEGGVQFQTWNFRISREGIQKQARLDLVDGDDILLHVKAVPANGRVVVNSRGEKGWGGELRIPVSPELLSQEIDIQLQLRDDHMVVEVPGAGAIRYDRHVSRLANAELRLSPGFSPVVHPGDLAGRMTVQILRADCMHVAGWLRYPDMGWQLSSMPEDARLVLLVDGRPSGAMPLPPPLADEPTAPVEFVLDAELGSLIADGMVAEVAVEMGGERFPLAVAPIQSRFAGGVERCNEAVVSGFVCNPALPQRPVLLDIFINDTFQATVPADLERPDLTEIGVEGGKAGFQFRFPHPVHLPVSMDVQVSVRVHNTDLELANSPWWVCRAVQKHDVLSLDGQGADPLLSLPS